jgi:hypothetical protein
VKPKTERTTASLALVGVHIGEEVLRLVGLGTDWTITFRRKISRLSLKDVFEELPPCVVGMEACLSAHFVSRTLRALGHEPRPPRSKSTSMCELAHTSSGVGRLLVRPLRPQPESVW